MFGRAVVLTSTSVAGVCSAPNKGSTSPHSFFKCCFFAWPSPLICPGPRHLPAGQSLTCAEKKVCHLEKWNSLSGSGWVETTVEVSKQNLVVLLLMSCPEGEEVACVCLCSSLISKVLETKEELNLSREFHH